MPSPHSIRSLIKTFIILVSIIILFGCQGGDENEPGISSKEGTLTVQPLQNISVREGQKGSLRVRASLSGFNSPLTYSWQCSNGGLDVEVQGLTSATISFIAPKVDSDAFFACRVNVGVKDGYANYSQGVPAINQSIIRILDMAPAIDAGSNQEIASGVVAQLNGINLNPNVNDGQYQWTQLSGEPVEIVDSSKRVTGFQAPIVPEASELTFQLQITNSDGETASDTVAVTIMPATPPIISVNYNESVNEHTNVILDASASTDDLGISTYSWRQVSGVKVELIGENTKAMNFIAPITDVVLPLSFELTLIDATNLETKETLSLNVLPVNEKPIIVLEGPSEVDEKTQVMLDASSSYDFDGEIVSYYWRQLSGPSIILQGRNSSILIFTTPISLSRKETRWELTITDELGGATREEKIITINPVLSVPVLTITAPEFGFSNETVRIDYEISDISRVRIEQIRGTKSKIPFNNSIDGADIELPIVNETEVLEFKITALDDDEKGSIEKRVEIEVSKPSKFTQIYFPINGSLVTSDTTSIQGRSTIDSLGVEASIKINLDGQIIEVFSDDNGYWQLENVQTANNITATTTYMDGSDSSHSIQLGRNWSTYYNAQDHIVNCGNNQMYHIWPSNIVETECTGKYKKTIASKNVGSGIEFSTYTDVDFKHYDLYLTTDKGLMHVDLRSHTNKRSFIVNQEDGSPIIENLIKVDTSYAEEFGWMNTAIVYTALDVNDEYFKSINLHNGKITPLSVLNSALKENNSQDLIVDFLYAGFRNKLLIMTKSGEVDVINLEDETIEVDFVKGRGEISSPVIGGDPDRYFIASKENNKMIVNYGGVKEYSFSNVYPGVESISEYSGNLYLFTSGSSNKFIKTNAIDSFSRIGIYLESSWTFLGSELYGALDISSSDYQKESGRLLLSSNNNLFTFDLDSGYADQVTKNLSVSAQFNDEISFDSESIYHFSNRTGLFSEINLFTGENIIPPFSLSSSMLNINYMTINHDDKKMIFQGDSFISEGIVDDSAFYSIVKPFVADNEILSADLELSIEFSPVLGGTDENGKVCYLNDVGSRISLFDSSTNTNSTIVDLSLYPEINGNVGSLDCHLNEELILISNSQNNQIYKLELDQGTSVPIPSVTEDAVTPIDSSENIYYDSERRIILHVTESKVVVINIESGDRALLYKN